MKERVLSICVFILLSISGWAQMPENRMAWKENHLEWKDFKGTPAANNFDANTNSGISYSWSIRSSAGRQEFISKVESFFLPDHSWVKPGKESLHLLVHEQLHFDITELHARKLRKFLSHFDPATSADVKKTLKDFYQKTEAERAAMQKRFDHETKHSQNAEVQLKWQVFLKEEMDKLKDFAS